MSYSCYDVVKISVLVLIFVFLTYNAASKFWPVPQAEVKVQVIPDFSPCKALMQCITCIDKENLIKTCNAEVKDVFLKAEVKCKGYISNLQRCKNKHRGPCSIESESADGCINSATTKVVSKWWAFAKGGAS